MTEPGTIIGWISIAGLVIMLLVSLRRHATRHRTWTDSDGDTHHSLTLTMHEPHPDHVAAYTYFGLQPPLGSTIGADHAKAMRHPYIDREWHRRHAQTRGYFWLPCPQCGRPFGGHEVHGSIPDPDYPEDSGRGVSLCALCAVENQAKAAT